MRVHPFVDSTAWEGVCEGDRLSRPINSLRVEIDGFGTYRKVGAIQDLAATRQGKNGTMMGERAELPNAVVTPIEESSSVSRPVPLERSLS